MRILAFAATKQGKDHVENEDSMILDNRKHLHAIADGVTIPKGGKEASKRAVDYLKNIFKWDLKKAVEEVNDRLIEDSKELPLGYTTIVAAAVKGDVLEVANVGDTPAFLVRGNKITMLSVQDKFISGSLTQVLGKHNIKVHSAKEKLKPNDYVILASDGITNVLTEEEILQIVKRHQKPKEIIEATLLETEEEPQEYDDDKTMIVLHISE